MPPTIQRVRWEARNLPFGISFDEQTGIFSGTPLDAGEYTVPVTVETNYGSDTKDVKIVVVKTAEPEFYRIRVWGNCPSEWMESVSLWDQEVQNLEVAKVVPNNSGFFLKTKTGEWYQCRITYPPTGLTQLPVSNVIDVAYGIQQLTNSTYTHTAYLTSDNNCIVDMTHYYTSSSERQRSTKTTIYSNIKKLGDGVGTSISALTLDNKIYSISSTPSSSSCVFPFENIKSFVSRSTLNSNPPNKFVLTSDGELYGDNNHSDGWYQTMKDIGRIKNIWFPQFDLSSRYGGAVGLVRLFVLTEDNSLYFWDVNKTGLVGKYATKNIIGSHMLTEDGTIYNLAISDKENVVATESYQDIGLKDMSYIGAYSHPNCYDIQIALY